VRSDPAIEVVDLDRKDLIFRSRSASHAGKGVLADESMFMYLPEDWMDRIEKVLGDANARVSVTGNVGVSDYGNKASASVTVTLTCNQAEKDIVEAHGIAREIMQHFLDEDQQAMEDMLSGKVDGGTKSATPAKAGGASAPAARTPAIGKPNFKRS
jgi:hypothetical protein